MFDKSFLTRWHTLNVCHSFTLVVVVGLILLSTAFFHVKDPTWALISGIVCTEFEIDTARTFIFLRILSTLIGVSLAALLMYLLGSTYFTLLLGTLLISLLCHSFNALKNCWKLATATGLIVLIAGLQQHSLKVAEITAFKRALEVIGGSLTAGIVTFSLGYLWAALALTQKR